MKFKLIALLLIFFPLIISAQEANTYSMYTLNKNNSLLLPHFDTSAITNSDVENIVLSLYVLNFEPEKNTEVQLTINPINLENRQKLDGISIFQNIQVNNYLDISLPKELFEKMLGTGDRILLKLVDPEASLSFAGINGATTDPKLTIETADAENPNIPNISLEGIREINNTTIFANNVTINNNRDGLPWWLIYIVLPIVLPLSVGYLIYKFGWNG